MKPVKIDNGPDIYIVGTANNYTTNNTVAVYWKNNIIHKLTDSLTKSGATDMVLSDTDVYVTGFSIAKGDYIASATYWKNETASTIGYNTGASAINVIGKDIFVAYTGASAHGFDQPFYWTSGTFNPLTDGSAEAFARAMQVTDGNIYVAGASANNSNTDDNVEATYWKNSISTKLVSNSFPSSIGNAITVQGSDVYIAGVVQAQNGHEVVYWKNGNMVKLASDPQGANAYAIAVHDSDIYVAGIVNLKGIYWKNGVPTTLSNESINSIAIVGNDVYLAGIDNGKACYWKNGTEVQLPQVKGYTSGSGAYKIIVIPHK